MLRFIFYKSYYLGFVIAVILGWLAYDTSQSLMERQKAMLEKKIESRELLKDSGLIKQSNIVMLAGRKLDNDELFKQGLDLLHYSKKSFLKHTYSLEPSESQRMEKVFDEIFSYSHEDFDQRGPMKLEALASSLDKQEEKNWGNVLKEYNDLLEEQGKLNFLLKFVQGLFTFFLIVLMIVSIKKEYLRRLLKRSEDFYMGLLQSLSEAVILCNTDGGIVFINEKGKELLSVYGKEILGRSIYDIFYCVMKEDGTIYSTNDSPIHRSLEKREEIIANIVGLYHKGLRNRWFLISSKPIASLDETLSLLTMVDITESIESRRMIDQQKAQIVASAKMTALGMMAGGIAHEINNPLSIIKLQAEDLQELASQKTQIKPDAISLLARRIDQTVIRISKIIKGLKKFSREGERDPVTHVDLRNIVDEVISFCHARLAKENVEIHFPCPDHPVMVPTQEVQISQVLLNLVGNSFDAITGLAEKWIDITLTENEDSVLIKVTDSGKGIPSEIREKIFMPFYTTKDVNKGTGLGLSISKGIIENNDGKLSIDTENPNTCFVIELPKKRKS